MGCATWRCDGLACFLVDVLAASPFAARLSAIGLSNTHEQQAGDEEYSGDGHLALL
jgi:hypothetical protein